MSLFRKTVRALTAVFATSLLSRLVGLVTLLVLAALLTPRDFGLVAQVSVVTGITSIIAEVGLSASLVRTKNLDNSILTASFILAVAMGGAGALLVAVLAVPAALLFRETELSTLIPVAALGLFLVSFGSVNVALLERELRFGTLSIIGLVNAAVTALVSIGLALRSFGVWSLVIGSLASNVSYSVGAWLAAPWRPVRQPAWGRLRELWSFGKHIVAINYIGVFIGNVDPVVVGGYLGTVPLGDYTIAQRVGSLVPKNVSSLLNTVMYPAYAQIENDTERLSRAYRTSMMSVGLLATPLTLLFLVLAPAFVSVFLGPQWSAVLVPMQIIVIAGFFSTIGGPAWNVLLAVGRPRYVSALSLVHLALRVGFGVVGALFAGLAGAVVGFSIAASATNLGLMHVTERLLKERPGRWVKDVYVPVGASLPSAIASWVLLTFLGSSFLSLVLSGGLGLGVYLILVHMMSRGDSTRLVRRILLSIQSSKT